MGPQVGVAGRVVGVEMQPNMLWLTIDNTRSLTCKVRIARPSPEFTANGANGSMQCLYRYAVCL